MSANRNSDHVSVEYDADRIYFIHENAVALVNDAECKIERLRTVIRRLENANRELRRHCNALQERLRATPEP